MCIYLNIGWDQSEQKACLRQVDGIRKQAATQSEQEACQRQVDGIPKQATTQSEQQACLRHFKIMCIYTCTYVAQVESMPLTSQPGSRIMLGS